MAIVLKVFIWIFKIAAALLIITLIAGLFISKDMNVSKEVVINKSKADVFNYIKLLKNQDNYSVWNKMDPSMKHIYTGIDGTVGFVSAWEGNNKVGKGAQTITKIIEGERLETDLHFIKPWESKAKAFITTTIVDSTHTKVSWGFDSKMPYPFNVFKVVMSMEKMLGNDYEKGLASLKAVLEK